MLTPIDTAALALVPLFVEARAVLEDSAHRRDGEADAAICNAFEALATAAETVSYRLLQKSEWSGGLASRDLMVRIDDVLGKLLLAQVGQIVTDTAGAATEAAP